MHGNGPRGPLPLRLGRYDLVREIGSGGMGRVYEGVHRAIHRPVAIKFLHERVAADPVAQARFVAEGRAIGRLRHPHIVQILDMEENEGAPYLVMELLEGRTLEDYLEQHGPLRVEEAVDLILPIVSALAAAHAIGVVHRDIKPSNIFLRKGGPLSPCLLDFGVSKTADDGAGDALTVSGTLVGTVPYFSPEHARGARNVTAQSDQFSLAIILYECLTGARPFRGDDQYELMLATVRSEVQAPSSIRPEVPPELDAVLLRALQATPLARFPSMRGFGSALLAFAGRDAWRVWGPEFTGVPPAQSKELTLDGASSERGPSAVAGTAQTSSRKVPRRMAIAGASVLLAVASAIAAYRATRAPVVGAQSEPASVAPAVLPASPVPSIAAPPSSAVPSAVLAILPIAAPSATAPPPRAPRPEPASSRAPRARAMPGLHASPSQDAPSSADTGTPSAKPAPAKDPLERWE